MASKTNAMRILEKQHIPFQMHEYESDGTPLSGVDVAERTGLTVAKIYKTLVTHNGTHYFVFVIPAAAELSLKKAAKAAGQKSVGMIAVKDIQKVTGYVRGGCSPVGMKKQYPTFLDQSAENLDTIIVSAGKIGTQVELTPQNLLSAAHAAIADLLL